MGQPGKPASDENPGPRTGRPDPAPDIRPPPQGRDTARREDRPGPDRPPAPAG